MTNKFTPGPCGFIEAYNRSMMGERMESASAEVWLVGGLLNWRIPHDELMNGDLYSPAGRAYNATDWLPVGDSDDQ